MVVLLDGTVCMIFVGALPGNVHSGCCGLIACVQRRFCPSKYCCHTAMYGRYKYMEQIITKDVVELLLLQVFSKLSNFFKPRAVCSRIKFYGLLSEMKFMSLINYSLIKRVRVACTMHTPCLTRVRHTSCCPRGQLGVSVSAAQRR